MLRSLTIREGISLTPDLVIVAKQFPHYTWGYIGKAGRPDASWWVPSLYVRVYRKWELWKNICRSSLTIREGISHAFYFVEWCKAFPHYTWGYITKPRERSRSGRVPSLYVRVYRTPAGNPWAGFWFPHYTWGYIGTAGGRHTTTAVPSLYVRVYRLRQ